jgi:glycosyltransferase involved in cell wall biosynthesis
VQNKVLEAMAMARPVVATENAVQGIPQAAQAGVRVVSGADAMSHAVLQCMAHARDGARAREFVLERYVWQRNLAQVTALFDPHRSAASNVATFMAGGA